MSKILAIKGDKERGNEVIALLEMMGGMNVCNLDGKHSILWISNRNNYICNKLLEFEPTPNFEIFTLDEFYAKYPYKVGDVIRFPHGWLDEIAEMKWDEESEDIIYTSASGVSRPSRVPENTNNKTKIESTGFMQLGKTVAVIFNDANYEDEVELQLGDYEIVVRDGKTYAVRKKPKYPKNYKDCFNICFGNKHHIIQVVGLDGDNKELFESFIKLKVCRDAYWKIAGEEMGLGKPWEPDYDSGVNKYGIICMNGVVQKSNPTTNWERHLNKVLNFPTEEMRDTFFEAPEIRKLIEQCKELL